MRKTLLVLAALVLVVGTVASWPTERVLAQDKPAVRERWEYATLTSSYVREGKYHEFSFSSVEGFVVGKIDEVITRLGGKLPSDRPMMLHALLATIGRNGWELVSVLPAKSELEGVAYYFKRRIQPS